MVLIGSIESVGVLAGLTGIVILAGSWRTFLNRETRLMVAGLLVWMSLHSTSNTLEWFGVTGFMDEYEDYLQVLDPLLWGFFFYAYLMAAEVADRKRGQELYRRSEERLSLAVEGTRIGLWDWRMDTGNIYLSEQWARIMGYTPEEIEPVTLDKWTGFYHPDDLVKSRRLLQDHMDGRAEYYECEARTRHQDGNWIWVLERGKVLARDESGRPVRIAGTLLEITERKKVMEIMRDEAVRRRALMDVSRDGIAIFNQFHEVVEANAGFARMLGCTLEEVLALHTWDFEVDMSEKDIRENFRDLAGTNRIFETRHRRKDGSLYHAEVSASGARVGNEALVVTITRDITERKAMEESLVKAKELAEAANRAKSEFLANMSHEIRTPLNGILGMLQLMQDSLDGEQKEYSLAAIQSAKRLTRLLSDILDVSRVEAGKLVIHRQPFDLAETTHQVCELFDPASRQSGVALHCHVDPHIPGTLYGDPIRLQQVLSNLIGNAFKFTDQGGVTVEAHRLPDHGSACCRVLFSVTDTGIGISDAEIGGLFEAFTQADGTMTRRHQGAGLGLTISKQLVELMGGSIAVETEVGEGSSFHFSIPFGLTGAVAGRAVTDAVTDAGQDAGQAGLRVLVAEDAPINQLAVTKFLEKHGHRVTAVRNGVEVLSALAANEFDVVLMDIQMLVMDGVEATKAIRRGEAGDLNRNIPIVALTACAMAGDRERFLEAGMDDYLDKPVEMTTLLEVVERVAGNRS